MPVLKYKLNGEWITLSGGPGGGGSVEVDPTLAITGMAADAKVTGDAIGQLIEILLEMRDTSITQDQLTQALAPFEEAIDAKQNQVIFNANQPANWSNGDIWLKPAE